MCWMWLEGTKAVCCSLCEQQNPNVIPSGTCEGCGIVFLDLEDIFLLLKEYIPHDEHNDNDEMHFLDEILNGQSDTLQKTRKSFDAIRMHVRPSNGSTHLSFSASERPLLPYLAHQRNPS